LVLQSVGANLIRQPNAAPFLTQVQHHAAFHFADLFQRDASSWSRQSQRSEPMASPVKHSECRRTGTSSAPITSPFDDGDMFLVIAVVRERHDMKITEARGQFSHRFNVNTDMVFAVAFTLVAAIFFQ
jgi:hypothetical protein